MLRQVEALEPLHQSASDTGLPVRLAAMGQPFPLWTSKDGRSEHARGLPVILPNNANTSKIHVVMRWQLDRLNLLMLKTALLGCCVLLASC